MTRFQTITMATCLLISSACFADNIYKWINDKGHVSYGNNPPKGVEAHIVTTNDALPSDSDVLETQAAHESIEKAIAPTKAATAPDPAVEEAKKAACEKAKEDFAKLASTSRVAVKDSEGKSKVADEDARKALVEERQAAVDQACAP
jgi:hypothetical protein